MWKSSKFVWTAMMLAAAVGCRDDRPFEAESACIPKVVAAEATYRFRVFSSCAWATKFEGLRCKVNVDGLVITVRTPAESAKVPNRGDDTCHRRGLDCELPPLSAGTYQLQFDDWAHELVVAEEGAGPAVCAGDPNSGCAFECPVVEADGGGD